MSVTLVDYRRCPLAASGRCPKHMTYMIRTDRDCDCFYEPTGPDAARWTPRLAGLEQSPTTERTD